MEERTKVGRRGMVAKEEKELNRKTKERRKKDSRTKKGESLW